MSTHGTPPGNGLVGAILATIFCCLPFGIVAIVKAAQVNTLWYAGQHDAARDAANSAGSWTTASVVCGIIGSILYFFFVFVANGGY
jgi:hypothetical protein